MERGMQHILLIFITLFSLFLYSCTLCAHQSAGYDVHSPVRINSNYGFPSIASAGNGTWDNPWIIKNIEINGAGQGFCLYIGNTTDYFIIQDCYLHHATGEYQWPYAANTGLFLDNADNCKIMNNVISDSECGLRLWSTNALVIDNDFTDNIWSGIDAGWGLNTRIINNRFVGNYGGIYLLATSQPINITGNVFYGNEVGVYLLGARNGIYSHNDFSYNTWGAFIEDGENNTFHTNSFVQNSLYSIDFLNSSNNDCYRNNFIDNSAFEEGDYSNSWFDIVSMTGNYWSNYLGSDLDNDGIGDAPFQITEWGGRDMYPLMITIDLKDHSVISYIEIEDSGWYTSSIHLSAFAYSDDGDVSNVTLYCKQSIDNQTWGDWQVYGLDAAEPWQWEFNFPNGDGYYILRTQAMNINGIQQKSEFLYTIEYDNTPPDAVILNDNCTISENSVIILNGSLSSDNIGILSHAWSFSPNDAYAEFKGPLADINFTVPGNYTVFLNVTDNAGNMDSASIWVNVIDTDPPVANAGWNRTYFSGLPMTIYGSNSFDDGGISNYIWTFTYNGTDYIFYGESFDFTFWTLGNYSVNLTVSDYAGHWDNDTTSISIIEQPPPQVPPTYPETHILWYVVFALIMVVAFSVIIEHE